MMGSRDLMARCRLSGLLWCTGISVVSPLGSTWFLLRRVWDGLGMGLIPGHRSWSSLTY